MNLSLSAGSMLAAMLVVLAGCGSDDGGSGGGVAEEEILIGSTHPGGGQLVANFDFNEAIHLPLAACVGGSDEMCTGGSAVYIASDPGFVALEEDKNGLFVIDPNTQLSIEITAVDAATSVRFEDSTLDTAGESAVLGTTPAFHAHGEFQIVAPGGEEAQRHISFVIKSDSLSYTTSEEYTARLEPGAEHAGHEHGE